MNNKQAKIPSTDKHITGNDTITTNPASLNDSFSKSNMLIDVKIHSPFKEYFQGTAFSVSAVNDTGPFDVLPGHHNFISLLSPCDIVIRMGKAVQQIKISGGIMHVKANKVIVFLDV